MPGPSPSHALKLPIEACPNCASARMRMATHHDGVVAEAGALQFSHCPECGFTGQPIVFRDRRDYDAFLDATLQEGRPAGR